MSSCLGAWLDSSCLEIQNEAVVSPPVLHHMDLNSPKDMSVQILVMYHQCLVNLKYNENSKEKI